MPLDQRVQSTQSLEKIGHFQVFISHLFIAELTTSYSTDLFFFFVNESHWSTLTSIPLTGNHGTTRVSFVYFAV